ncbi:ATPase [uncultured Fusobacterium sp.]|uniref:ATPase n=1 Tax=uncultured Fusobacterium sp. TaxID=159267 RepID=UPI00280483D1|nr:ATPase [uncultured Fusobacterium sp.]
MEQIKSIFKRAGIAAAIILIYGIVIKNEYVYIGMFSGSVMSIIMFYMICMDIKSIAASESVSRKRGFIGYAKRYLVYGVYLGVMAKFFGLPMLLSSAIGLLNVKVIILLMTLSENIGRLRDKFLR